MSIELYKWYLMDFANLPMQLLNAHHFFKVHHETLKCLLISWYTGIVFDKKK